MITSTANKQIKYVNALVKRAKTRKEEGLFVVEGLRICQELPKQKIRALYLSESFSKSPECAALVAGVSQVEVVSDPVFEAMADTKTPQGILALTEQLSYAMDQVVSPTGPGGEPALLMVLERLQDPGNLGTIVRAGEGAGVTGILMDQHTADIYNPKVIRSTMGSVFRVPFLYTEDLPGALKAAKQRGIRLFAAHLGAHASYEDCDYCRASGFLIGNEGAGLSREIAGFADELIRIPMMGQVESLNAAVASSVLMFEASRQRRRS